ncbi:hypothetical protein [Dactylosporangium maewongense]|uniref:hypothetical protein n=1 Tax=Dactylosporangium maewongense TaxID=634393 RepID=UPI0031D4C32A
MALSAILAKFGSLVAVGTTEAKNTLQDYCEQRETGSPPINITFVECTYEEWKRVIHHEISTADCVLLYIAPKEDDFPTMKGREAAFPRMERYYSSPFKDLVTGSGLLREVLYLDRLQMIERTIIICNEEDTSYIESMIALTSTNTLFFMSTAQGPRAPTPRLWALDRQLARLRHAAGTVPFTSHDTASIRSRFASNLRRQVKRAIKRQSDGHGRTEAMDPSAPLPINVSDDPRRLPPDGELKIVSHTNVEDLIVIPNGEIMEVPPRKAQDMLSGRATRKGCPTCKGAVERIFFYIYGLRWNPDEHVRAKCQRCTSYLMIEERRLIEV